MQRCHPRLEPGQAERLQCHPPGHQDADHGWHRLPRIPAAAEGRRARRPYDGLSQHSQRGVGDSPGGFRLRDQALHAGRNHAGRTPPAAPRCYAERPQGVAAGRTAGAGRTVPLLASRLVPVGRSASDAGRGRAHGSCDIQDRIGLLAADRRGGLSRPAAGRRDRGRQAAAVHSRAPLGRGRRGQRGLEAGSRFAAQRPLRQGVDRLHQRHAG